MMTSKKIRVYSLLAGLAVLLCAAIVAGPFAADPTMLDLSHLRAAYQEGEELAGGATTVRDTGHTAFGRSLRNIAEARWDRFFDGKRTFDRDWSRVSSVVAHPPAGPFFSAASCGGCHARDGRGRPPLDEGEAPASIVFQLGMAGENAGRAAMVPDPLYGDQLNLRAVAGEIPEGKVRFSSEEIEGRFADGDAYILRKPVYTFTDLRHGALDGRTRVSVRVAPAVFGLGLLERVPEALIVGLADPDDRNADGISGRPNYIRSVRDGRLRLGRFGWKANQPSLEQQIARAFLSDMGITTPMFPYDPGAGRIVQAAEGATEIDRNELDKVINYIRLLAVPARRASSDPSVLRGKAIFGALNCAGCHQPTLRTGDLPDLPELASQTIHPYSDMLLHDMGEELADGRPDGLASGQEWRTPPLWGIGLVDNVNHHTRFLHDGRAGSLEEAVLWHGGEASVSRDNYLRLSKSDRSMLLAFLESL